MPEESVIKRHYFDPGVTLHTLAPGHEMRIPALVGSTFKVKVTSRDNWLEIEGNALDFARQLAGNRGKRPGYRKCPGVSC